MAPVTGGIANCIRSKKIKVNIIGIFIVTIITTGFIIIIHVSDTYDI